jgi:kojibiose phosphorylase
MARYNLRQAAAVAADPEEAARWRRIADGLYLGLAEGGLVVEQFAGFFGLAHVELGALGAHYMSADMVLGRDRTARSQVVKQADVVMLLALLWDELPPAVRRASFLYYEPRTAHGSSLSPGVHALVALRLGLFDLAERYLDQTASIDLGNTMGNAAGGVHAAALGSLWQAVVRGAAGIRPALDDEEALAIEPRLPPPFRSLAFPLAFRGRWLQVIVEPGAIEVAVEEGEGPVTLHAIGPEGRAVMVRAEPGTRHATRSGDGGYRPWEAIRS